MHPRRLLAELRRRKVLRVAGLYIVGGWAAIEAADTLVPLLLLPDWLARATALAVIAGFPIALALAWAFDLTAAGVVRTPDAPEPSPDSTPAGAHTAAHPGGPLGARAAGYVGLGMVIALVSFGAYAFVGDPPARSTDAIESLAVLPFVNTSGDPENEYFSDGITDELLDALGRIEGLRVPARTSSYQFKGENIDVRDAARRLNVGAVLEGSVRRADGRVRITAKLVDAQTGFQIWGDSYDRELVDLFAVQDEIARRIVAELRLQIAPAAARCAAASAAAAPDVGAHDLYLLGRYHFHRRGAESLRLAERHFRAALDADPDYAAAWAGLALTWAVLPIFDPVGAPADKAMREGGDAARRALALDPDNAHAHAALGQLAQNFAWDWAAAERRYTRAAELAPQDGTVRQWRAEVLAVLGRPDAATEMEAVLALDPLSPITTSVAALVHMLITRDFTRAIELWRRAESLDAEFPLVLEIAPLAFAARGDWPEARTRLLRLASSAADSAAYTAWADAAAATAAGRTVAPDTRAAAFDAATRFGGVASFGQIGEVLLAGPIDPERALALLDRHAADPRYRQQTTWLGRLWFFDTLQHDPRLHALAERLGLPPFTAR